MPFTYTVNLSIVAALKIQRSCTVWIPHAHTPGEVVEAVGISVPISPHTPSFRTLLCHLYPLPTPSHSWKRPADAWRKFPNPLNRGTSSSLHLFLTLCMQFLLKKTLDWCKYWLYGFHFTGIQHQAFRETRVTQCLFKMAVQCFKRMSTYLLYTIIHCSMMNDTHTCIQSSNALQPLVFPLLQKLLKA